MFRRADDTFDSLHDKEDKVPQERDQRASWEQWENDVGKLRSIWYHQDPALVAA